MTVQLIQNPEQMGNSTLVWFTLTYILDFTGWRDHENY